MPINAALLSFVRRSKRRKQILEILTNKRLIAADIAKEIGMYKSHVARTLNELNKKKLIVCENPRDKAYRYYHITVLGKHIFSELEMG